MSPLDYTIAAVVFIGVVLALVSVALLLGALPSGKTGGVSHDSSKPGDAFTITTTKTGPASGSDPNSPPASQTTTTTATVPPGAIAEVKESLGKLWGESEHVAETVGEEAVTVGEDAAEVV